MILKNKSGITRDFKILFEFENKENKYIIYEDYNTLNIYGGRKVDNYLEPLDDKEYTLIDSIIKKILE